MKDEKGKKDTRPPRAWFEVRETHPGIHGNTGLSLKKGERHRLDPELVGGEEGNELFKPVDGPHKKKETPPAPKAQETKQGPEEKQGGDK